jgi:hypothetical protein
MGVPSSFWVARLRLSILGSSEAAGQSFAVRAVLRLGNACWGSALRICHFLVGKRLSDNFNVSRAIKIRVIKDQVTTARQQSDEAAVVSAISPFVIDPAALEGRTK